MQSPWQHWASQQPGNSRCPRTVSALAEAELPAAVASAAWQLEHAAAAAVVGEGVGVEMFARKSPWLALLLPPYGVPLEQQLLLAAVELVLVLAAVVVAVVAVVVAVVAVALGLAMTWEPICLPLILLRAP